jgi:hypothetical protein
VEDQTPLDNEIEAWRSFESALRQDNRILFAKMLSEVKEHWPAFEAASNKHPTEALLMAIILQQQKMITRLIARLEARDDI